MVSCSYLQSFRKYLHQSIGILFHFHFVLLFWDGKWERTRANRKSTRECRIFTIWICSLDVRLVLNFIFDICFEKLKHCDWPAFVTICQFQRYTQTNSISFFFFNFVKFHYYYIAMNANTLRMMIEKEKKKFCAAEWAHFALKHFFLFIKMWETMKWKCLTGCTQM